MAASARARARDGGLTRPQRHDANRKCDAVRQVVRQTGHRVGGPAQRRRRRLQRRPGQQHDELVAAVAGHHVRATQRVADRARDHPQHVVAVGVGHAVVDALEAVQVDQRDREWLVADLRGQLREALVQRAPVGQAGERVLQGLLRDGAVLARTAVRARGGCRGWSCGTSGRRRAAPPARRRTAAARWWSARRPRRGRRPTAGRTRGSGRGTGPAPTACCAGRFCTSPRASMASST